MARRDREHLSPPPWTSELLPSCRGVANRNEAGPCTGKPTVQGRPGQRKATERSRKPLSIRPPFILSFSSTGKVQPPRHWPSRLGTSVLLQRPGPRSASRWRPATVHFTYSRYIVGVRVAEERYEKERDKERRL